MKISLTIGQFRIVMIGGIFLSCGLALPVILPIWIMGEIAQIKDIIDGKNDEHQRSRV